MFLKSISISGFKSFAKATELRFGRELTAIVGPNGAGKSNILDAVRWCLGEQSLKAIRGKKSTDVLFAGSSGRRRANMTEVELILDNADHAVPLDYTEVTITRRLHRDGESEYLLSGQPTRLADITLLLAQANFGQKSYSIISQGMVDHVIAATPAERLQFFIEATGVRQYQLRRDEAVGKLALTATNLQEASSRLAELQPVLNSLTRQVKRLEKREQLANELSAWQNTYYWHRAKASNDEKIVLYRQLHEVEALQLKQRTVTQECRVKAQALSATQQRTELFARLQANHAAALAKRDELLRQVAVTAAETALDEAVTNTQTTPARGVSISDTVTTLKHIHSQLVTPNADVRAIAKRIAEVISNLEELRDDKTSDPRDALKAVQKSFQEKISQQEKNKRPVGDNKQLASAETDLAQASAALSQAHQQAQATEQDRAQTLGALQLATEQLAKADAAVAAVNVDIARWQAQAEDLAAEVRRELRVELNQLANSLNMAKHDNGGQIAWEEKIQKLKEQVAQAGGIDPEITDEYRQVKQRCDFLTTQTNDLGKALTELQKVVRELDKIIDHQFHANFKVITAQFTHYFKALFNGGKATLELVTLQDEPVEDEQSDSPSTDEARLVCTSAPLSRMGIQINACPPGKKVNAVQALSGGERTLLSTALLCAVVACNPSPFVIMDEVDAALDEANAERLAIIFHELNQKTQIIVITHNRVIMQHADVLYGVTMSAEGDSRILSLSLKDAKKVMA